MTRKDRNMENEDGMRISRLLRRMYWIFLGLSLLIIFQIVHLFL